MTIMKYLYLLLCCFALASCQNYSFSLNEKELYSPAPLLTTPKDITDNRLKDCIKQTIIDKKIRSIHDLNALSCTYAGIESIEGIGSLSALTQLNLSHNKISTVKELLQIPSLTYINLNTNEINEAWRLTDLPKLVSLKLAGNKALACTQIKAVEHNELNITLPKHCNE